MKTLVSNYSIESCISTCLFSLAPGKFPNVDSSVSQSTHLTSNSPKLYLCDGAINTIVVSHRPSKQRSCIGDNCASRGTSRGVYLYFLFRLLKGRRNARKYGTGYRAGSFGGFIAEGGVVNTNSSIRERT